MRDRREITDQGVVQGVGFRPFVHSLASRLGLSGTVRNVATGVAIDVEGELTRLQDFIHALITEAPPLAHIVWVAAERRPVRHYATFSIELSEAQDRKDVFISPDVATCAECLGELLDPCNRRYHYPFLNCTNCGPRFTIVVGVPYDRERTTMGGFTMCTACRAEYEDPRNRRFHAQPTACAACGPRLRVTDSQGNEVLPDDPLALISARLREGKIVAVKGLGGYHLACDALQDEAVRELRRRKHREAMPLGIMVQDLDTARRLCQVSADEAELLSSPRRPIVLVRKRDDCPIAKAVAPRNRDLGIMLPYTPVHHLLLRQAARPLVMTSGNLTEEPIACEDHLKNTFCLTRGEYAFLSHHIGDLEDYRTYGAFVEGIEHFKRLFDVAPQVVGHDLHPG